jgi:hypothetical protein
MRLDLLSGWQLEIAIERDQLGALLWARAADGRQWEFGCQRDDWTLGPDSRIVEPVALLEPEQRQELERRMRDAICWPAAEIRPELLFPSGLWQASTRRRRSQAVRQAAGVRPGARSRSRP